MSTRWHLLDLIETLDPRAGGPPYGIRLLGEELRSRGHEARVLTLDAPGDPWLADWPGPVRSWPGGRGYGRAPGLAGWLARSAGADRPDVVVVNGLWKGLGVAAWRARRRGGPPYVVFPHGMLDPWFRDAYPRKHLKKVLYWRLVEHRVLAGAAAVLFTADEERERAAGTFRPYRVRAETVAYGTRVDAGDRAAAAARFRAEHPELAGRRLLLFFGRVCEKKGVDLLLDAFAGSVRAERAEGERDGRGPIHLVLAGPDGPEWLVRRRLERGPEPDLDGRVTATGLVLGPAKEAVLAAAEAYCLPSHQENFSIATVEALARGVPAYVSRAVNIAREIVEAGAGVSEPDDAAGTARLVEAWRRAGADEIADRGRRGRELYARRFTVEGFADSLLGILGRRVPRAP